jgi:chorismate synthase
MEKQILDARALGDSVGGVIECVAEGIPAGLGGLMFGGMESRLAAALYAIPGVKGVEFGAGFSIAGMKGSEANDPIRIKDGRIFTTSNNSGGINGGLTNGMPLVLRCAFRPTPSISRPQNTIDLQSLENTTVRVLGRHDPCIVPRALPVVEAMTAFCILDALLGQN